MPHKPLLLMLSALVAGCAASPPPLPSVAHVDLSRYAGSWYVIASIPTWIEKDTVNAIEHYELAPDGSIPATFSYRRKRFDAPLKTLSSTATVVDHVSNAEWAVQFVWPFKAEYRIAWLAADYAQVIVARSKRDYVWYMARTPSVSDADFAAARRRIAELGYDVAQLVRVPQRGPDAPAAR
ncbi:lipocalin family protein [Solimonas soli]|uniref:lipocalin family protein n=1 Tax=Solimonas soli TaxID=413479 RepID=UPI0004BCC657|nr:lipocalin family protein [Solimonas soli]